MPSTGTPLDVVGGVVIAVFVQIPLRTAANVAVTTRVPPIARGPMFVHESVPVERFVALAKGACVNAVNKFV